MNFSDAIRIIKWIGIALAVLFAKFIYDKAKDIDSKEDNPNVGYYEYDPQDTSAMVPQKYIYADTAEY